MRKRKEIENDGTVKQNLILEVLLDLRDLMLKQKPKAKNKKKEVN